MKTALKSYCRLYGLRAKNVKKFFGKIGDGGMGTVEIIIIIAVLVALALLFKTFIMDLSSGIFQKIQDKTDAAIDSL